MELLKIPLKLARLAALLIWACLLGLLTVPPRFFQERWKAIRRLCDIIELWGAGILRILNVKIELYGSFDRASSGGALVVSNHLGVLDIFVHSAIFGFRFAPKSEIRSWPLIGHYIGLTLPVWVDRKTKSKSHDSLKEFQETMRRGISLIVYPEGTSTDGKSGVLPFKSTLFESVIDANLPVRPVLTLYRVPKGSSVNPCWYGDMTLLPHLWDLLSAPGITAELRVLPEMRPDGRDRKEFAAAVHDAIQAEMLKTLEPREVDRKPCGEAVELDAQA